MTTGSINYLQVGPGGLCFAHGPYSEGGQCPQWPACATDPQNPEYVALGKRLVNGPKEHARLKEEVVEAALRLRRSTLALKKCWNEHDENEPHAAMEIYDLSGEDVVAREVFDAATDALLEFESQQGIKK